MDSNPDRREFVLGFVAATFGAMLAPKPAAASGALGDQPWAVWDYKHRPVRGGYFRAAVERYIGKMNWPVLDWISMGYFHERLMLTDGEYKPTVPWLLEELKFEDPQTVLMRLREGIEFHDGSKFNAAAVKYQMEWIRDPKSNAWTAAWLAPLVSIDVVDERTLRWKFNVAWAAFSGVMANVPGYAMSAAALQADVERYDREPRGTGPYLLEEASPDNFLKLKRKLVVRQGERQPRDALLRRHPRLRHSRSGGAACQPACRQDRRADAREIAVRDAEERSQRHRLADPRQSRERTALQHNQRRVPGCPPAQGGKPRAGSQGAHRRHAARLCAARKLHVSRTITGATIRSLCRSPTIPPCRSSCSPMPAMPTA